jgi:hypothetical protein
MAAVGGCSAGVSPVKRPPPGTGQGTEAADSAALASGAITGSSVAATEMEVTIGSGPDTGSHRAESSSVTCTYGLSALGDDAEDSFGNQFADDSSAGLSALELIVPDTKQASARGTEAFMLSIRIGKPAKAHRYRINSLPDRYGVGSVEGSGELRLDDDGAVGVLSVRGTTSDGIPVDALIRCNSILDADGQPRD